MSFPQKPSTSDTAFHVPFVDLQAQLDAITANTRSLVQPERLAITDDSVATLFASGIEEKLLPVGSTAPSFTLPDALTGKPVRSEDLLALGPVIIKFFRGRWDPYDMTELEVWQSLYTEVRARGALLVAISPQLPRQNDFTVQRHNLTFPVLSDPRASVAESFGLTWVVPPALQRHYRSILVNIPYINGDESWRLPLPATVVVARRPDCAVADAGVIVFSEAYADHRVRPEPSQVFATLVP